jgi:hypothetical protein
MGQGSSESPTKPIRDTTIPNGRQFASRRFASSFGGGLKLIAFNAGFSKKSNGRPSLSRKKSISKIRTSREHPNAKQDMDWWLVMIVLTIPTQAT